MQGRATEDTARLFCCRRFCDDVIIDAWEGSVVSATKDLIEDDLSLHDSDSGGQNVVEKR